MRRLSLRITPTIRDAAQQMAQARGITLAALVRGYLRDYLTAPPAPVRTMPNRRGNIVVTVYVGPDLGRQARAKARENDEKLAHPIIERLTRDIDQWSAPTETEQS